MTPKRRSDQTPARSRIRSDRGRVRKLVDPKVKLSQKALDALKAQRPLEPPMTDAERIAIAIAHTRPRFHVTLTTLDATHEDVAYKFRRLFVPRIERHAHRRRQPLVYVVSYARSRDGYAGWHAHALLWEEPYRKIWRPQSEAAGFGRFKVDSIDQEPATVLYKTAYVLGQHQSILGSEQHLRHLPLPKGKRPFNYPHMKTLESNCPKLFHAFNLAKDPAVTDENLISSLPIFIRV